MSENMPYDPSAPEGDDYGRSQQYVSKKDFRVIAVLLVVFCAAAFPIFRVMQKNAQRSMCKTNLGAIAEAINQYASVHDDRFPPVMRMAEGGVPQLGSTGLPYTWASDLAEFKNKRSSFRCPAADDTEVTQIEGQHGTLDLTYGMYQPYGGLLRTVVPNPDQTILIVETSNHGAKGTYNPVPYKTSSGEVIPWDGFVVGWNNSNDLPDANSKLLTRLAYPDTSSGTFTKETESRHGTGILALNCSGSVLKPIPPEEVNVRIKSGLPSGMWEVPAIAATRR